MRNNKKKSSFLDLIDENKVLNISIYLIILFYFFQYVMGNFSAFKELDYSINALLYTNISSTLINIFSTFGIIFVIMLAVKYLKLKIKKQKLHKHIAKRAFYKAIQPLIYAGLIVLFFLYGADLPSGVETTKVATKMFYSQAIFMMFALYGLIGLLKDFSFLFHHEKIANKRRNNYNSRRNYNSNNKRYNNSNNNNRNSSRSRSK